jgi:hypothetical protein
LFGPSDKPEHRARFRIRPGLDETNALIGLLLVEILLMLGPERFRVTPFMLWWISTNFGVV